MTDDRQHEYIPQIAPGVLDARLQAKDLELQDLKGDLRQVQRERDEARLALRELKAERSEAQHDATERLIERNNLAEALREVNSAWQHDLQRHYALMLDVLTALKAAQEERDAARNVIGTLSARMTDSEALSRAANRACDILADALREVNARLVEVTKERNEARNMRDAWHTRATAFQERLTFAEAERDVERANHAKAIKRAWKEGHSVAQFEASPGIKILRDRIVHAEAERDAAIADRDALAVNFAAAVKSLEIYSGAMEDDHK